MVNSPFNSVPITDPSKEETKNVHQFSRHKIAIFLLLFLLPVVGGVGYYLGRKTSLSFKNGPDFNESTPATAVSQSEKKTLASC